MLRQGRSSRSWSRTRSPERESGRMKRRSAELRRSVEETRRRPGRGDADSSRFVLTDPVAFKYLEDDPSVSVLEAAKELSGFQCYIVEQWATSRTNPTFVITIYTGDPSDKIMSSILAIPKDESSWSERLEVYFASLNHYHARRRDTPDGIIMITSLPGFPSTLAILPVPGGDVRKHYADFFVNLNLKRLGCAGRLGLTLESPNSATSAKFYQLYRTSEKLPLHTSVVELVRMCQIALHLFDMLEADFIDGLLCDVTERAVRRWWSTIGSVFHHDEPGDTLLGPTTVAALMCLFLGARRRLQLLNEPVPKDSFDTARMKKGIAHFQKSHKLHRSRRLDKATLIELHKATQKVASADGWHIPVPHLPHAVKTTVAEISGKGDELLAQGQTKRGKAGVRDIESADMDSLPRLVVGETAKWLWQGKTLKKSADAMAKDVIFDSLFTPARTVNRGQDASAGVGANGRASLDTAGVRSGQGRRSLDEARTKPRTLSHRDTAARKVQDVIADSKNGFDRLRGATNPQRRMTDRIFAEAEDVKPDLPSKRPPAARSQTSPVISPSSATSIKATSGSAPRSLKSGSDTPIDSDVPEERLERATTQAEWASQSLNEALSSGTIDQRLSQKTLGQRRGKVEQYLSGLADLPESESEMPLALAGMTTERPFPVQLRRTHSSSSIMALTSNEEVVTKDLRRQLSFSIAIDSMSASTLSAPSAENITTRNVERQFMELRYYTNNLQRLYKAVTQLSAREAIWTSEEIARLEKLVRQADEDAVSLREQLDRPTQEAQQLRALATAALHDEQDVLDDGRRELETLAAKIDYEINSLNGKIEDVENGVDEFERAVKVVEGRVEETGRELRGETGWRCIVC